MVEHGHIDRFGLIDGRLRRMRCKGMVWAAPSMGGEANYAEKGDGYGGGGGGGGGRG